MERMLAILRPLEDFLHATLGPGFLRDFFFVLFKYTHLFFSEYTDYLVYALTLVLPFYLMPRRWRVGYLLVSSMAMIAYIYSLTFVIGLALFPIGVHVLVRRWQPRAMTDALFRRRAIAGLISVILTFYAFLLARESFAWTPDLPFLPVKLELPMLHVCGIAFMLPKLIHYVADSLQGKIRNARTSHVALFMLFFPTLRLGPIERFQNFDRDLRHIRRERVQAFDIGFGLYRIALGLFKTFLYAAFFYPWRMHYIDNLAVMSIPWTYWILLSGIMEVYCHFGGYTDIAVGLGRLFGFKLMENFYLPFLSENIGEYWRRWHISLSFWLRDYVYRPLGGGRRHALVNGLITFVICGAWHYVSWHYIIWGFLQGFGLGVWRAWAMFWARVDKKAGFMDALKPIASWMRLHPRFSYTVGVVFTLHYFCMSGAYFFLETDQANLLLLRLFTLGAYVPGP